MKLQSRRTKVAMAAAAMALLVTACGGSSEDAAPEPAPAPAPAPEPAEPEGPAFPEREIQILLGHGPGGLTDNSVRPLAEPLSDVLGVPVVIVNTEGAGGMVAANEAAGADADGYTLFAMVNPAYILQDEFGTNAPEFRDFEFIGRLAIDSHGLTVAADSPYQTLDELIAAAESGVELTAAGQPGASNLTLFQAIFEQATGISLLTVPFESGSAATRAAVDGTTDVSFGSLSSTRSAVDNGEARVLTYFAPEVMPGWEDVELFEDRFPGTGQYANVGILAPPGTPADIVAVLRAAVTEAAADSRYTEPVSQLLVPAPLEGAAWRDEIDRQYAGTDTVRAIIEAALAG